jgi:hypothetical protein
MSTSSLEHIAEDLISHVLQRHKVLVAKPKFDHNGADLLALLDVEDGAKFCRIQCKGRSLVKTKKSHITIPTDYVTDGLVVVLYIEDNEDAEIAERKMFCFFGNDIRQWPKSRKDYRLSFSKDSYKTKLTQHIFCNQTADKIRKAIIDVNVNGEFKSMGHGYAEISLFTMTVQGTGS